MWFFIIVVSAIWVFFDAKSIGVKKGLVSGLGNMNPVGWFFAVLLLWIVGFPAYLFYRGKFKAETGEPGTNLLYLVAGLVVAMIVGSSTNVALDNYQATQASSQAYTIKISGTEGEPYSGSYFVTTFQGSKSKTVDGYIPNEFNVTGSAVSVSFQKQSDYLDLTVTIEKDGLYIDSSTTYADYGVVTLAVR
ncbi:MAG: hypothetical protein GQ532_09895 [Methylomarinum sp.]|nr:hypothetical protein [Methylomarinum sp.]